MIFKSDSPSPVRWLKSEEEEGTSTFELGMDFGGTVTDY